MKNYHFLLIYLIVFTLSFLGLIDGGSGSELLDIVLLNIFFVFTYVSIFCLKIYNFKENNRMIPVILFTSSCYFYQAHFLILVIYLVIMIYLLFFSRSKGEMDPVKSVFLNFFSTSNYIDLLMIVAFISIAFLDGYLF